MLMEKEREKEREKHEKEIQDLKNMIQEMQNKK